MIFDQQTFQPGETRTMPVVFVVNPDMSRDLGTVTKARSILGRNSLRENGRARDMIEQEPRSDLPVAGELTVLLLLNHFNRTVDELIPTIRSRCQVILRESETLRSMKTSVGQAVT